MQTAPLHSSAQSFNLPAEWKGLLEHGAHDLSFVAHLLDTQGEMQRTLYLTRSTTRFMEMKITVRLLNEQYVQIVVMEGWEN